jgi:hypothetical protein
LKVNIKNLRKTGFTLDEINEFKRLAAPVTEETIDTSPVMVVMPNGNKILVAKTMGDIAVKVNSKIVLEEAPEEECGCEKEECECARCKYGNEEQDRWEKECIEKFGWFAHYVGEGYKHQMVNIHTHGIKEKWNHLDLQIVVPLPNKMANEILHNLTNQIKNGKVFLPGERDYSLLGEYPITFKAGFTETDRPILRVILPDPNGCVDNGIMKHPFGLQYLGLEREDETEAP